MRKEEFQTLIHLLFLAIIAGSLLSSCKEKVSPVTSSLGHTKSLSPIHHKKNPEIKAELIGDY